MVLEEIINKLENKVKPLFESENTGHDITHLQRVTNLALKIQEVEGGDRDVIGIAACVHDVHRVLAIQTEKSYCTPKESLGYVEKILNECDLDKELIEKVLHCIEFHEETNFMGSPRVANDIETLIVQDADNLDSMGAIGIARSFTYGGAHNIKIWNGKPLDRLRESIDISVDSNTSIEFFYEYMLKLENTLNTKTAQELAKQKHKFVEEFLEQFFREWDMA